MDEKAYNRMICIQRYKNKKRIWNKKIQYKCRKEIADGRLRFKGRFISKNDQNDMFQLVN